MANNHRLRRFGAGLAIHSILSFALLGGIRVYQQSYNTLHRDQVQMASMTIQEEQAEIRVLGRQYLLPMQVFSEDSLLYYAAYGLMDETLYSWSCACVHILDIICS